MNVCVYVGVSRCGLNVQQHKLFLRHTAVLTDGQPVHPPTLPTVADF